MAGHSSNEVARSYTGTNKSPIEESKKRSETDLHPGKSGKSTPLERPSEHNTQREHYQSQNK